MATTGRASASEWDATAYHRVSTPQLQWAQELLADLTLAETARVLDAGCGSGRVLALFADRVPSGAAIGLDRSLNMLRLSREHLEACGHGSGRLVQADLLDLPFVGCFDLIFSAATFHWIHDHNRLFGGLYRALRPGGRLVAQCGGGPNLARLHERTTRLMADPAFRARFVGWREPWNFPDAPTTHERLRRAGFTEVETSVHAAPTRFLTRFDYVDFIRTVVARPFIAVLSPPEQETFLERIADEAANDEPRFELDYWRLNLRARRPA